MSITSTNCDLRLARIIALLTSSDNVHLTYVPDDETYLLTVDAHAYTLIVGSDDDVFHFIPDAPDTDAPDVIFSIPTFMIH